MNRVLNIFSKYDINLIGIAAYSPVEAEKTPVFIFIDITNKEAVIGNLLDETEKELGYRAVIRRGSIKGLMVDELAFPLYSAPEMQAIIMDGSDLRAMIRGIYEKMGESPASAYLYHFSYSGGKEIAKYMREIFGLTGKELLREAIKIYMAYGWGRTELIGYADDLSRLIIRIHDSIECSIFKDRDRPMSHFIRGHLTGLLEGLFDEKINLVETKCIALGDAYCEFSVKP